MDDSPRLLARSHCRLRGGAQALIGRTPMEQPDDDFDFDGDGQFDPQADDVWDPDDLDDDAPDPEYGDFWIEPDDSDE